MTNKFISFWSLSPDNGSGLNRRRIGDKSASLCKFFTLFLILFLPVGQMWGATATLDASCITSNAQSYQNGPTTLKDKDGNEWKVAGYGATKETNVVIGKGGANYLETPNFSGNISSIKVTWSGNTSYYLALQTTNGTELEAKNNPSTATEATFTVSGSYKQLRLVGRRSSGTSNAAATITKVVVTYGSSCTPLTMSAVTATPGNAQIALSWPNVASASSYTVTCKVKSSGASAGTVGGVTGTTTKSCTITGLANGTEYTWSVMPVGTGSYCAENTPATGDATPNVSRTITYYDKDGQHSTSLTDGTNIATALNALYGVGGPTSCNTTNYNYFVGWKDGEISGTATSVTLLSTEVVNATTAAKSYYAVWSDTDPSAAGGWEVATSITVGDVVMLGYNASKQLSGISTTSTKYGLVANFPSGDADAAYPLTVCAGSSNGTFAFKNSNNSYLYWGSGNSLTVNATLNANTSWTFTYSAGTTTLANASDNTRKIKYNSNDTRFAAYTSAQNDISLYKRVSVSANYITTCCTPLGSINGSVSQTNPTTAVLSWDAIANVSAWTVKYRTHGNGNWTTFNGDINTANNRKSATITTACGTKYDYEIIATPANYYCAVDTVLNNNGDGFDAGKYAITLDPANGEVTGGTFLAADKACDGDKVDLLAEAATGYSFSSWTITKASSGTIDPAANIAETTFEMPAEAVTVSAAFSLVNYTITYANMEGATNHANNPATYTVNSSAITLGAPTKDGFDFGGWFTDNDLAPEHAAETPAIAAGSTGNKTFYAKWTQAGTHTVTIADYSNGSVSVTYSGMESALTSGSRDIAENTVLTITATPNDGYDGLLTVGGEDFTSGSTHTLVADITIEALFEPKTYTISYKDEGGAIYSGSNLGSLPDSHTYNSATALVNGVKAGYSFGGWFTDEDCTESAGSSIAANSITADITLYAKWEELTMYTVTWKVNGATYTAGTPSTSVEDGSKVTTLPTAPTVCDDDLTFMGWTNATIEGTQVSAPDILFTNAGAAPAVTGNVTYHAVFAAANQLTATFNPANTTGLTKGSGLTWTHNASSISIYISSGSHYTSKTPNTFTVSNGTTNYCYVESPDGVTIKKVILTVSGNQYVARDATPGTLETSGTTQTITSVNDEYLYIYATTDQQIRITNLDVKYTPASPTYSDYRTSYEVSVPTPTLDVASGKYTSNQLVTISNYDGNYMYFYTTNGSTPAADANLDPISPAVAYDSNDGIEITETSTVKVIAYDLCHNAGEVTTATYTIAESLTLAEFVAQKPTTDEKVDITGAIVMAREDKRLYIQKGEAAMCLYYSAGAPSFAVGKQIANGLIQGSYDAEYLEMEVSNAGSPTASADGVLPTPLVITDDNAETLMVEANMYRYAQINSVTLDEDTYSYLNAYSTTSDNSYYYEDQFSVLGTLPLTTTECTVKGIINPYTSSEVHYFDQLSPILTNDILTNATAVLPTISDLGGTDEAHAVEVAEGKEITITEDANFDAIYQINDGAETAINSSAVVTITNTEAATKVYVKASRDYYADNSVTYYYIANSALTEHVITCATGLAGGSIAADKSSAVTGATVTLTPSPAEHYSLTSWTVTYNDGEEKTINVVNNQFTMPGYAVNVTAAFAEDAYATVSFAKGDEAATGDVPANQKVYVGNDVTLPANPFTFAGHNFAGWKYNETTKQAGETYAVTAAGSITFTAQWIANPICTVTLHANGAEDVVEEVVQGATYNMPDAGALVGYTFVGWTDAAHNDETTEAISVVSSYTPEVQAVASTKEFYAVYSRQEGETKYEKVTSAPADWSGQYLIVNEEDAKVWKGSSTDDNAAIDVTITNHTIAASATVDAERFTIATMTGGYSIKGTSNKYIAHKEKSNAVDNGTTYNNAAKVNTISLDGDGNAIISSSTAVLRQNNSNANLFRYYKSSSYSTMHTIQLYKYIEAITYYTTNPTVKYNVSYELGEGAWRANEGCDASVVEAGTVYNVVCEDQPVLENKVFDKWQVNDADIVLPYTINANTAFTAVYRDAVQYAVNYDKNGGVGNAPAATNVLEDADYTVLANSWFFRSGYTFEGWNTAADGTGAAYAADAVMAMPSADVTLYAQWQVMPANEKEVVIVAKAGESYYAMGQTLTTKQFNAIPVVGVSNGKVILPNNFSPENKTAITWHMITNDNGATASFYSPANNKYLAHSGTDLALSSDPVTWTWNSESQCYINNSRTFMYRSTYGFRSYNPSNFGTYSDAVYVTTEFAKAITEADATETSLSLGDNIVVQNGATLTIGNQQFINDVVVENGGNLTLNANVSVHDLIIHSTLGKGTGTNTSGNAPGNSGQIVNGDNITVTGDAWIEIELTQESAASYGWYAFSVPFRVDAMHGVYGKPDGEDWQELQNEVGYAIMKYHGDVRAQGLYGWKKYRDIMEPGTLYIIAVGKTEYKTLRFKKHGTDAFNVNPNVSVKSYPVAGDVPTTNRGWNGIGNPNMQISYLPETNKVAYMQFLIHEENRFQVRTRSNVNVVVGSAFFVQYSGNSDATIEITPGLQDGANGYLAPKRERNTIEETIYEVELTNVATEEVEDNIFLTAREEALNEYEVGRDLAKMSMGEAKCAQMWVPAYGTQLCAADFQLINDKAEYPLIINTPKAGTYSINAQENENATIYLTYNGRAIWNLSMSACELDLTQGLNEGYGLRLVVNAPAVVTGVDQIDAKAGAQKVIIDEHVYILRGGQMYDVNGKLVK